MNGDGTGRAKRTDGTPCKVCQTLLPGELVELDLILGDPLRWPATVWGAFSPPEGSLPASYRKFGMIRMGEEFLMAHGYEIRRPSLVRHVERDVPILAVDVDELLAKGLIAMAPPGQVVTGSTLGQPIDPLAFVTFFQKGIDIGMKGLDLLLARITDMEARGEEVPLSIITKIIDTGTKLASSQAAIRAAGKPFGSGEDDLNDGFRGGDDISPRFDGVRVRVIDGQKRPVADEGPADRAHYNARARQEGSPELGGRRG